MSDADLLSFLRYFVSTRNWATWNAISDAYADAGDELGAAIAVRIRDGQYWPLPLQGFSFGDTPRLIISILNFLYNPICQRLCCCRVAAKYGDSKHVFYCLRNTGGKSGHNQVVVGPSIVWHPS